MVPTCQPGIEMLRQEDHEFEAAWAASIRSPFLKKRIGNQKMEKKLPEINPQQRLVELVPRPA